MTRTNQRTRPNKGLTLTEQKQVDRAVVLSFVEPMTEDNFKVVKQAIAELSCFPSVSGLRSFGLRSSTLFIKLTADKIKSFAHRSSSPNACIGALTSFGMSNRPSVFRAGIHTLGELGRSEVLPIVSQSIVMLNNLRLSAPTQSASDMAERVMVNLQNNKPNTDLRGVVTNLLRAKQRAAALSVPAAVHNAVPAPTDQGVGVTSGSCLMVY